MNKIAIAKTVTKTVVSHSVGFTVSNVITSNLNVTKNHHKVLGAIGTLVIGSYVSEKLDPWVSDKFDSAVKAISDLTSKTDTK